MELGHPYDDFMGPFFQYWETGQYKKGRDFLINDYIMKSNYNDFYKLVLYSFGYDAQRAKEFLENKGLWRPDEISFRFDYVKHQKYISKIAELLDSHILALKKICEAEDIILVLQTYPTMSNSWSENINTVIRNAGARYNIPVCDQEKYFREKFSPSYYRDNIYSKGHINERGYRITAQNLSEKLERIIIDAHITD